MIFVKRDSSNQPKGIGIRNKQRSRAANALRKDGFSTTATWSKLRREARADINALFSVFHRKCAYCESDFNATGRNQLEHYRPKMKFFSIMFVWNNWLCSCGICNEKKWSHWPLEIDGTPTLLDPTNDKPEEHVGFVDASIIGISIRGTATIRLLGLDRQELERERRRWLGFINILMIMTLHSNQELVNSASKLLAWCVQPWAPYCAMVRAKLDFISPGYSAHHVGSVTLGEPIDLFKSISDFVEKNTNEIAALTHPHVE